MSNHEKTDADVRSVAISAAGLAALLVVAMAAMGLLFFYLARREPAGPPASPLARQREIPPEPRLQVTPSTDLGRLRAAENAVLNSYAWVDREAGIVRIPIERAMELVVERGLPQRSGGREQGKR